MLNFPQLYPLTCGDAPAYCEECGTAIGIHDRHYKLERDYYCYECGRIYELDEVEDLEYYDVGEDETLW